MKEPRRVFTFTRELVFIKTPEKVWDVTHERNSKRVKKNERIQVRGERKRPA